MFMNGANKSKDRIFVDRLNRLRYEIDDIVEDNAKYHQLGDPEKQMKFLLEKIKNGKSKAARACRDFVEVGVEFMGRDSVSDFLFDHLEENVGVGAVDEEFIYDAIDEIINMYSSDSSDEKMPENQNVGDVLEEVQHIRHLLDILEKHTKGKLTPEDVADLKKNSANWAMDIEKLGKMINSLNMDPVL